MLFDLAKDFLPKGDQPQAIEKLAGGIKENKHSQVLLGITGSGKTFTMANVIQEVQKPALILAHNKTLAAQLYQEFKGFFPNNAVEYFVSYYDYYQPEAYIPRTDTYIEKDLAINDKIDQMRHSATRALLERKDVIIVSSVSCIYGLGMPEHYAEMHLIFKVGESKKRDALLFRLVEMHYQRTEADFIRATFRLRGDVLEVFPAYEEERALRIEFFEETIERISEIEPLTGRVRRRLEEVRLYPGSHHVIPEAARTSAMENIRSELSERMDFFEDQGLFLERERIHQRTLYDLEMIKEVGTCKGIENYSRHFSGRYVGEAPACLLNYFPKDYLLFIDESHQTIPQLHAMYNGDRARKKALVDFGFRLPSAFDNRPLRFEEVYARIHQVIYVSATPGTFEISEAKGEVVEQVIRPTGLLDPIIEVRPATHQVDDVLEEIRQHSEKGGRILVTTLTKKLSEELTHYLTELGVKAKYLHSDIDTLERLQILYDLRIGTLDVVIGINLLREGLDLPEVSLVAILDADKEGFLRSQTSLIQTCGRAARNVEGRVIMYADKITDSIRETVEITHKRRIMQEAYNKEHGITPRTIKRSLGEAMGLSEEYLPATLESQQESAPIDTPLTQGELQKRVKQYEQLMREAAQAERYEEAGHFRDLWKKYQEMELALG